MIELPESIMQRRPLVDAETAGYLLDCSPDAVRVRVDEGKLIAFDLRSRRAQNRSCLRILARSLVQPVPETEVLSWVPKFNPLGTHLVRLLGVSQWLVAELLKDELLRQIGKPARPKQSPRIDRESLVAFLKSRRTGAAAFPLPSPSPTNKTRGTKISYGLHTVRKGGVAR